ncbi:hypothetical protein Q1695_003479 [Nippostrongylus brasiliensis]|nr:hypothetical protein Q1695_003479 [Nippostrongylus brasiliensis]
MNTLALLLVLLVAVEVKSQSCGAGNDEQLPLFAHVHKNMNLSLDCQAVKDAIWAAQLLMDDKPDHVNNQYWCKYYTHTWSGAANWDTWIKDVPLRDIPFDKVAQTALLHPRTKYGCAAKLYRGMFRIYYTLMCIYQKKAPQQLCNIQWSID